jgi:hypothetical protein
MRFTTEAAGNCRDSFTPYRFEVFFLEISFFLSKFPENFRVPVSWNDGRHPLCSHGTCAIHHHQPNQLPSLSRWPPRRRPFIKPTGPRRTRSWEHDPHEPANNESLFGFSPLPLGFVAAPGDLRDRDPPPPVPPPQISPRRQGSVPPPGKLDLKNEALRSLSSSRGATPPGFGILGSPRMWSSCLFRALLRSWTGSANCLMG